MEFSLLNTILAVFVLGGNIGLTSQSPVYVRNKHEQLVTSTSLKWISAANGTRPQHAVSGGRNDTHPQFVCRATLTGGGDYHAGQLVERSCQIVVGDHVLRYNNYQILVNVDGSARLEWLNWQQFTPVPRGAVSVDGDQVYAARSWVELEPVRSVNSLEQPVETIPRELSLGGLYLGEQYGLILVPGGGGAESESDRPSRHTHGQLLIEHEPARFEMTTFNKGRLRGEQRKQVQLENKELEMLSQEGKEDGGHKIGRLFNVSHSRTLYFGRGHSIPSGSSVTVTFPPSSSAGSGGDQKKVSLEWGVPKDLQEFRQFRLDYPVPRHSRVKVSLSATEVTQKHEYSATLLTHYRDGAILMRPVSGVYQVTFLDNFRPVYGTPMSTLVYRRRSGLAALVKQSSTKRSAARISLTTTTTSTTPSTSTVQSALTSTSTTTTTSSSSTKKFPSMVKSYRYPVEHTSDGRSGGGTWQSVNDMSGRKGNEGSSGAADFSSPWCGQSRIVVVLALLLMCRYAWDATT